MLNPIGISSTRISSLFVSQQLLTQMEGDQTEMYKLQEELASGHAFSLPSENPSAALQVIGLQRQLANNGQSQTNLQSAKTYLNMTDSILGTVSQTLNTVQGVVVSVVGATASDQQRQAAAAQVQQAIQELTQQADTQFNGRYLFAGAATATQPYTVDGNGLVHYRGDTSNPMTYADTGLLVDTGVNGDETFGGLSPITSSGTSFTPALTGNTALSDLNHGQGITPSSIRISLTQAGNPPQTTTSVIDLSKAKTLGDVTRIIHADPAVGAYLNVQIGRDGLDLSPATGINGSISVQEVGNSTMAHDLGIYSAVSQPSITGTPLHPTVQLSTPLVDLSGTRASTVARFPGSDNDVIFQTTTADASLNGKYSVQLSAASSLQPAGTVVFTPAAGGGGQAQIFVDPNATTAADLVNIVNTKLRADGLSAELDPSDNLNGGQGLVGTLAPQTLTGGVGTPLDLTSGIQIVNGDNTYNVATSGLTTVQDLLNKLNNGNYGVRAAINSNGTGITLQSQVAGADFSVGELGGSTATDLGLRTFTNSTTLSQLNYGQGVTITSGTSATATAAVAFTGANNDLLFTAMKAGADANGYTINFTNTASGPGNESISVSGNTINVAIAAGQTTAASIVTLFNNDTQVNGLFQAALNTATEPGNDGSGTLDATTFPVTQTTAGGTDAGVDFTIQTGTATLKIDLHGDNTVGDVIQTINNAAQAAGDATFHANLATTGNGIQLSDTAGAFTITNSFGSTAANNLGLLPTGVNSASSTVPSGGTTNQISGSDVNPSEATGVFNALLRVQQALTANNQPELQRAMALLQASSSQLTDTQALVGAKQQGLDALQARQQDENTQIQSGISNNYDADFAQVASDFTLRQTAYQAALEATGSILKLSLLNYL